MACISEVRPLALDGGGPGRRAAFKGPRGAEDAVMLEAGDLSKEVRNDGGLGEVDPGGSVIVSGLEEPTGTSSPFVSCVGGSCEPFFAS